MYKGSNNLIDNMRISKSEKQCLVSKGYEECIVDVTNEIRPQCENLLHFLRALDDCRLLDAYQRTRNRSQVGTFGYGYVLKSNGKLGYGHGIRIV